MYKSIVARLCSILFVLSCGLHSTGGAFGQIGGSGLTTAATDTGSGAQNGLSVGSLTRYNVSTGWLNTGAIISFSDLSSDFLPLNIILNSNNANDPILSVNNFRIDYHTTITNLTINGVLRASTENVLLTGVSDVTIQYDLGGGTYQIITNVDTINHTMTAFTVQTLIPPPDSDPPGFDTAPTATSITGTGFTLNTDIDEEGEIAYVVLPDGAAAPTSAEVISGTGSGGGSPITSGDAVVNSGDFSHAFSVSGLSSETAYDVYVVAQDDESPPNVQASPTLLEVMTSDITPPSVNSITVSGSPAANAASVTFVVAFDESVSNVSADDFTVTAAGTASGTIASVSASSGSSINVVVNAIAGDGTLRLDLNANTNIVDGSGNGNNTNGYVAAFTSGATHTIDRVVPILAAVTPVPTPSDDTTPSYTFSSSEAGTISYGGSCSSATTAASAGNNTVTFNALSEGTYSDCTVTVTDSTGNASAALSIASFEIDVTKPTLAEGVPVSTPTTNTTPSYVFSTSETGTLSMGGSCGTSSSTTLSVAGNQTITLTQSDNTTALTLATYTDCSLTVTDAAGNASDPLSITSFTITFGAADRLVIVTQPVAGASGASLTAQPVIQIQDNMGNVITTATDSISVAVQTGNGTLGGTPSVNAVNGVATFTDLTLADIVGANSTLRFSSGSLTSADSSSISPTGAGAATQLAITTQPVAGASGEAMTSQPVVAIQDSAGNVVTTATDSVSVAVQTGNGTLSGTTSVNAVNGVATFTDLTLADMVGASSTLRFSSGSLTSADSSSISPTGAGAAAQMAATSGSGQIAEIDTAFAVPLVVTITDASGNPVAGETVTFTPPVSGASATIQAGSHTTDANGQVSVTATANSELGGPYDVVAASGSLTSVTFALTNDYTPEVEPSAPAASVDQVVQYVQVPDLIHAYVQNILGTRASAPAIFTFAQASKDEEGDKGFRLGLDWLGFGLSQTNATGALAGDGLFAYVMAGRDLQSTDEVSAGVMVGAEYGTWDYDTEADVTKTGLTVGLYGGRSYEGVGVTGSLSLTHLENDYTKTNGATASASSFRAVISGAVNGMHQLESGASVTPYVGYMYAREELEGFTYSDGQASAATTAEIGRVSLGLDYVTAPGEHGQFVYGASLNKTSGLDTITLSNGSTFTPSEEATGTVKIGWFRETEAGTYQRIDLTIAQLGNDDLSEVRLESIIERDF